MIYWHEFITDFSLSKYLDFHDQIVSSIEPKSWYVKVNKKQLECCKVSKLKVKNVLKNCQNIKIVKTKKWKKCYLLFIIFCNNETGDIIYAYLFTPMPFWGNPCHVPPFLDKMCPSHFFQSWFPPPPKKKGNPPRGIFGTFPYIFL